MQSSANPKETIGSIAARVFKQDGLKGFYRGAFANLTKVAPSASIGYYMYEQTNKLLGIQTK
jgi:solute carrier family 25 (mitochondrial phosphate transporter), member 23/24/25/41